MFDTNKEFLQEIEELVKDKYGRDRDLKYVRMVEEIEKRYDLQIKKQNANDDEKKIEEIKEDTKEDTEEDSREDTKEDTKNDTKEDQNVESEPQKGKNYLDKIFSFRLCKSIKWFKLHWISNILIFFILNS